MFLREMRTNGLVRNLMEELRHALSIMATPDDLAQHRPDIKYLDFRTPGDVIGLRDRIGHDELFEAAFLDSL